MKNPNCSEKQLRSIASSFSLDTWNWLCTRMDFLKACDTLTPEEIRAVADVLLTEKLNETI